MHFWHIVEELSSTPKALQVCDFDNGNYATMRSVFTGEAEGDGAFATQTTDERPR